MYKVIDLFAGAGGLSLGFMQTGKFDIKVAFENNPDMQKTYKYNHPNVDVRGDVCAANYDEIKKHYGNIDIVIGGPPCQGFSNANRQKNHAVSSNNMLVKQYIRAITELQPKAFIMENVSMLRSEVHRFYLEKTDADLLEQYNIPLKETHLELIEKKYYFKDALKIITQKNRIRKYKWSDEDYLVLNIIYKASKNTAKLLKALEKHKRSLLKFAETHKSPDAHTHIKRQDHKTAETIYEYFNGKLSAEAISEQIAPAIMIQRMLSMALEIFDNNIYVDRYDTDNGICAIIRSFAVYDYIKAILESKKYGYTIKSDVLCAADYGAPQKRMRFVIMGVKKELCDTIDFPAKLFNEENYRTVHDAIADLENAPAVTDLKDDIGAPIPTANSPSDLGKKLRDSKTLKNHIITKTTPVALERFKAIKQGQNFHSLKDELKNNTYTDTARTQNTIYLRLNYNEPSGTVVNVRKSMWIHPVLDRAISVREAARLQTFPDSFVFCGTKDKQYQQVGNAVPPIMANAIAKKLAEILENTQKADS